jgi:hypothetical protein
MNRTAAFSPSLSFAGARMIHAALDARARDASRALNAIAGVGTGRMGLTPDEVKFSPAYRAAHAAYQRAAAALRTFNVRYAKAFKRELATERAERRASGRL